MVPSRVPFCLFTSEHTLIAAAEQTHGADCTCKAPVPSVPCTLQPVRVPSVNNVCKGVKCSPCSGSTTERYVTLQPVRVPLAALRAAPVTLYAVRGRVPSVDKVQEQEDKNKRRGRLPERKECMIVNRDYLLCVTHGSTNRN